MKGETTWDGWRIPETEIYETVQVLRRKLVLWLRVAPQAQLDSVMDGVLRASATNGGLLPTADEVAYQWAKISGARNRGRFTQYAMQGSAISAGAARQAPATDDALKVPEITATDELNVVIDVMVMQLTLKASHPQALPEQIAKMADVVALFGRVSMQASLIERCARRETYQLVGRAHSLGYWKEPSAGYPRLESIRSYYAQELYPSEKKWLPGIFQPFYNKYFNNPLNPLLVYMPEEPLAESAEVAYLVGTFNGINGILYEFYVYKARRVVHAYQILNHGSRFYRSLTYTSDARFSWAFMQPATEDRDHLWPEHERHAAGDPTTHSETNSSVVITREWALQDNLSLGTETYMPPRLLVGLLPEALIANFRFWQDEDDQLRGYPLDDDACNDIIYVRLTRGAHVATHGAKFMSFPTGGMRLPPTRAQVYRLKRARCERMRDAVLRAFQSVEAFVKKKDLLLDAFKPTFKLGQSLGLLLTRLGGHQFGPNADVDAPIRLLNELLSAVDVMPLKRRQQRHRVADVILPALVDALQGMAARVAKFDGAPKHATGAAQKETPSASIASASDIEDHELVLLDLLAAPKDSLLESLTSVLTRIETIAHILAWARYDESADLGAAGALGHEDLMLVSLPRLKLTFQARRIDGVVRLYSVDHSDLYITNERDMLTNELLAGIPHSLILSNSNGERSVLVAADVPIRPSIRSVPFSTALVIQRNDKAWAAALDNPYYVYPVHISLSFLYSTTLASALYLLLLRYLHRQYKAVVRLVDTVATDAMLTREERNTLMLLTATRRGSAHSPDEHPDAHACLLQISLVMVDSPISLPWDLTTQMAAYINKLAHVSSECRLSPSEELILLKHCVCDVADPRYRDGAHSLLQVLCCRNRRSELRERAAQTTPPPPLARCDVTKPAWAGGNGDVPGRPTGTETGAWIYTWHDAILEYIRSPSKLDGFVYDLRMRYKPRKSLSMDEIFEMLSDMNRPEGKPGLHDDPGSQDQERGLFLFMYELLQGTIECSPIRGNCSQGIGRLFVPFMHGLLGQNTLLSSVILTLARAPLVGQFLPTFDCVRNGNNYEFLGRTMDDGSAPPLARLLREIVAEMTILHARPSDRLNELTASMIERVVEAKNKRSVTVGAGWGQGVWGVGLGWGSDWGAGSTDDEWGGGGWGAFGKSAEQRRLEFEQAATADIEEVLELDLFETRPRPTGELADMQTEMERLNVFEFKLGDKPLPKPSDHGCKSRRLRPVTAVPLHASTSEESMVSMVIDDIAALGLSADASLEDVQRAYKKLALEHHPDRGGDKEAFQRVKASADRLTEACGVCGQLLTTAMEMRHFAATPLQALPLDTYVQSVKRAALGMPMATDKMPFAVGTHPDALSKVAVDMITRIEKDVADYATQYNQELLAECAFLTSSDAAKIVEDASGLSHAKAEGGVAELIDLLTAQREADAAYVCQALPLLLRCADTIVTNAPGVGDARMRELFALRQAAELEAHASLDLIFCLLISSKSATDLRVINPFLSDAQVEQITDLTVSTIMHASRVGALNRALNDARALAKLLRTFGVAQPATDDASAAVKQRTEAASALTLKARTLAEGLLVRRHYVQSSLSGGAQNVGGVRLRSPSRTSERTYDPRFLLFEFTHNLLLREAQVEMVGKLVGSLQQGKPIVEQMLMGGGKSTVIAPLLALLLADGATLVMLTMPLALLEQQKAVMRATFSSIMRKRSFTLTFDRSSQISWSIVEKLKNAITNCGVVLCTAPTIKSLQLKLLEKMHTLSDASARHDPSMELDVCALVHVVKLFRTGCLVMDEVDLLLHPLKSELNFPLGCAADRARRLPARWCDSF